MDSPHMRARHPNLQDAPSAIPPNPRLGKKRTRKTPIQTGSKLNQAETTNEPGQNPKRGAAAHKGTDGKAKLN